MFNITNPPPNQQAKYHRIATGDYDEHSLDDIKARQPTPSTEEEDEEEDEFQSIELFGNHLNNRPNSLHPHDNNNHHLHDEEKGDNSLQSHSIRNETPQPITRPPTKYRDWLYGFLFIFHFVIIFLLSFFEELSLHHTALSYNRAASEASIVMIVTLLGGVIGGLSVLFLFLQPTTSTSLVYYLEGVLKYSLSFTIILKICLINILLFYFLRDNYYVYVIITITGLILSLIWDFSRYSNALKSISFTITLIELIIELNKIYGLRLFFMTSLIIAGQTCLLLWWGAFFIGLIATISIEYLIVIMFFMFFSLYWIVQVFHGLMAFLIGGCTLRLFIDDDIHPNHRQMTLTTSNQGDITVNPIRSTNSGFFSPKLSNNITQPQPPLQQQTTFHQRHQQQSNEVMKGRVYLYLQCALTTSFGSICRAALWMSPSQCILLTKYWLLKDNSTHPAINPLLANCLSFLCCCCRRSSTSLYCISYFYYFIDNYIINYFHNYAKYYHKLIIPLLAVYGKTLLKTSELTLNSSPEIIISSMEEYTTFLLNCYTSSISVFFAILFALFAESKHEKTWPIFLFICYLLLYSGISLCLYSFSSAVDALIVASSLNPTKLAEKNQLVLLRFLRLSEVELR